MMQQLKIFNGRKRRQKCLILAVAVFIGFAALPANSLAAEVGHYASCGESSSPPGDTCASPYVCQISFFANGIKSAYVCGTPFSAQGIADTAKNIIAAPITWASALFLDSVVNGVEFILSYLIAFLLALGGWFIDFALSLNSEVFTLPVVQLGWRITRDVANLGFVLGIIVIAFATIVRSETYGIKKTLFKLIMIAVLINFSLSICGVFLDASAIATNFFLSKATPNGTIALSQAITQAFKPQALWNVKQDGIPSITGSATGMLQSIAGLFFVIIFSWMGVVTYFALGVMLLIRFVEIAFLLILAPIAWLGWVFPGLQMGGTGNIADMWRQRFIKWTFFPPIVSFFIYLALYTIQTQSAITSLNNSSGAASALSKGLVIGSSTVTNLSFPATRV